MLITLYNVYLGLGSNLGDRQKYLQKAVEYIQKSAIELVAESSIYETSPIGYTEQPNFLNMVVKIKTILEPNELLLFIQKIEAKLHRKRKIHWGPRTIDIDILLIDHYVIHTENLIVPHPSMIERLFVLIPLAEIYGGQIPGETAKIKDIIKELGNEEGIKRWKG